MSKYWNNQGRYQAEFDRYTEQLMPASGHADTVAGELVRSVNRIYYDAFNNGFCNNTSGALNFIKRIMPADEALTPIYQMLAYRVNSGGYSSLTPAVKDGLDTLVDKTVELLQNNPVLVATKNTNDMFDFQEPDFYEPDDEEDYIDAFDND